MNKPLSLAAAFKEAFELSEQLDKNRRKISPFESKRLERLLKPVKNSFDGATLARALVADIERDFDTLDKSINALADRQLGPDLQANIASLSVYSFNFSKARELANKSFELLPDNVEHLEFLSTKAWVAGDISLVDKIYNRLIALGAKKDFSFQFEEVKRILNSYEIPFDSFITYADYVSEIIRSALAFDLYANVRTYLEVANHEDGSESIAYVVVTDLEEDQAFQLDEDLIDLSIDPSRTNPVLNSIVTPLVRDFPEFEAKEA